jgi:hypothetical protein
VDRAVFEAEGALLLPGALGPADLGLLEDAFARHLSAGPGKRLIADAELTDLLTSTGAIGRVALNLMGSEARPVRAVLFDKTPDANWAVAWHQDRTIVVQQREDVPGYGPWSTKDGLTHVAPPITVLGRMITVRAHLDPCGPDNAPLKVALGSHHLGRVPARDAEAMARRHPLAIHTADAGDLWAYATPILHASDRAGRPSRRRVLQVDYTAFDLPAPLRWLGVQSVTPASTTPC